MNENIALVVGAGRGRRLGGGLPKQYQALGGEPMIRRTIRSFLGHPNIKAVRAVIHPDDEALFHQSVMGLNVLDPVHGGENRQESVLLGLKSLTELNPDYVLIHDAARPYVDQDVITRVIAALDTAPGVIPVLPVADTLKKGHNGLIETTVDRNGLYRAQTPQGFHFAEILSAHKKYQGEELTDDSAVAEKAGLAVSFVEGNEDNFKVTTGDDLLRASRQLGPSEGRTGIGFDVHRFCPGDHVMICGVAIPHEAGLEGHSDADVGIHAITDALLGAICAGDIGVHFPPSDPQWADVPSDTFLRFAGDLVAQHEGRVVNIDLTIICENPRIGPYREKMSQRVGEILGITQDQVNIKGTTTEGLGFPGRGEGIAAQAVATVIFPGVA